MKDSELLIAENIQKSFGSHIVLKDISMKVQKGDVTCIIGASICWKYRMAALYSFMAKIYSKIRR